MPKGNQSFSDSRFESSRNFNRIEDKFQTNEDFHKYCLSKGFTAAVILRNDEGDENIWYLKTVDPKNISKDEIQEGDVKKDFLHEKRLVYFGDDQQVFTPNVELRMEDQIFSRVCKGELKIEDGIEGHKIQVKGDKVRAANLDDIFNISLSSPEKGIA